MATAKFRFHIHDFSRVGIVFAGWTPNGPDDAIPIDTGKAGATMKVWCAPYGGPVTDLKNGGTLYGELDWSSLDAKDLERLGRINTLLLEDSSEGKACQALVKPVVKLIAAHVD